MGLECGKGSLIGIYYSSFLYRQLGYWAVYSYYLCTATNFLYRKLDYLAGSTTSSFHLAMAECFH